MNLEWTGGLEARGNQHAEDDTDDTRTILMESSLSVFFKRTTKRSAHRQHLGCVRSRELMLIEPWWQSRIVTRSEVVLAILVITES